MERLQRLPLNGSCLDGLMLILEGDAFQGSSMQLDGKTSADWQLHGKTSAADHAGSPTIQAATGHSASSLRQLKVAS
jgi:hypothetical protein